jgi:hypothetical protein
VRRRPWPSSTLPVSTGVASRASDLRAGLHGAAGLVGWAALIACVGWRWAASTSSRVGLITIAGTAAILLIIFALRTWVEWNRSIYRRRHRRTRAVERSVAFDVDALGRPVAGDPATLMASPEIVIRVTDDGVKHYDVVPASLDAAA